MTESEAVSVIDKPTTFEQFMREEQYNQLLHIADMLDSHKWSRSIPKKDMRVICMAIRKLAGIANSLRLLREELKQQVAIDAEIARYMRELAKVLEGETDCLGLPVEKTFP